MPNFKYTAKNIENKLVKGERFARDKSDLYKLLRTDGLILIENEELDDNIEKFKIKSKDISEFSRQVADMVGGGIPVSRAIAILRDQSAKRKLRTVYSRVFDEIQKGFTLSEAMRSQGIAFPELFVNMYRAGEESGQLEKTAQKMAIQYEKDYKLNSKIRNAMMYPICLIVVTIVVVIFLFTFVLPNFFKLFEGIELPLITKFVMGASHFMTTYWYIAILIAVLIIAGIRWLFAIPKVKLWYHKKKVHVPMVGKLLKIIYTARFSRTLSSLYSSGMPMVSALEIASGIIGNVYVQSQFQQVITNVRNGEPLSRSLGKVDGFDPKLEASVYVGEESGHLEGLLETMAESFDYEAENATTRLVTIIEPIMIIIMAFIIGTIMISVMLPIMTLYKNIG